MAKNYYLILGVASEASSSDIKAAFRRRAMELHPDTSGLESGPFMELQEAYGVLGDPERRSHYDREAHGVAVRRGPWRRMAEPLVSERRHGEPLRPPASAQNFREIPRVKVFEREGPTFDEIFDHLWSHFQSGSRPKSEALQGLTVAVVVGQEEARFGGRVQVNVPARATGPTCGRLLCRDTA